jgi:hypothetical protein
MDHCITPASVASCRAPSAVGSIVTFEHAIRVMYDRVEASKNAQSAIPNCLALRHMGHYV